MTKPLKILGVIGDPISHSLSPIMHNSALAHLKLPFLYMPFQVKPKALKSFFCSLKNRNISGLNVTIPHKQGVIPFMTGLSKEAKLIGAVNTIVIRPTKLIGYNTDCLGYLESLKREAKFNVKGKRVILLGAGGAARAICAGLGLQKAKCVLIADIIPELAFDLMSEARKKFPKTIFGACTLKTMDINYWSTADLLINATPMGMKGKKLLPLPLNKLPKKTLVSDIVYTPVNTPLLKKAKRLGLKTHAGWGMFLYQGVLAFELFTRHRAPVKVMRKALLKALKETGSKKQEAGSK